MIAFGRGDLRDGPSPIGQPSVDPYTLRGALDFPVRQAVGIRAAYVFAAPLPFRISHTDSLKGNGQRAKVKSTGRGRVGGVLDT